jgi:hypothetical protein
VTTPAWVLVPFARYETRTARAALAAVLAILPALIMHGGPGFTQFGNRFSLDYTPFLLILVASAIQPRPAWWMQALIVASIAINDWGVVMITKLDWWVF